MIPLPSSVPSLSTLPLPYSFRPPPLTLLPSPLPSSLSHMLCTSSIFSLIIFVLLLISNTVRLPPSPLFPVSPLLHLLPDLLSLPIPLPLPHPPWLQQTPTPLSLHPLFHPPPPSLAPIPSPPPTAPFSLPHTLLPLPTPQPSPRPRPLPHRRFIMLRCFTGRRKETEALNSTVRLP